VDVFGLYEFTAYHKMKDKPKTAIPSANLGVLQCTVLVDNTNAHDKTALLNEMKEMLAWYKWRDVAKKVFLTTKTGAKYLSYHEYKCEIKASYYVLYFLMTVDQQITNRVKL